MLRALIALYLDKNSPHPLPPGSDVRSVYLVDPGLAVIDVNAAFADGHRSGVLSEELTVASLIQTLSANIPGILKVKILVEGKQRAHPGRSRRPYRPSSTSPPSTSSRRNCNRTSSHASFRDQLFHQRGIAALRLSGGRIPKYSTQPSPSPSLRGANLTDSATSQFCMPEITTVRPAINPR